MLKLAKNIKRGDIFIYRNQEQVAIEDFKEGCLWVTNKKYFLTDGKLKRGLLYGYSFASVIIIDDENQDVEILENLLDSIIRE